MKERKPGLIQDDILLRSIIKNIDVNDCLGNLELVKEVAKCYATLLYEIQTPISPEPLNREQEKIISDFANKISQQKNINPEFSQIVQDNFYSLLSGYTKTQMNSTIPVIHEEVTDEEIYGELSPFIKDVELGYQSTDWAIYHITKWVRSKTTNKEENK